MAIANTNTAPILKEGTNITLSQVGQTITITATDTTNAPGGSNTQVQFNDSGVFGGDAGLTYNKTTNVVSLESVDFATTPAAADAERRLKWDQDEGSLVLTLKGGNVTIPLGAEVVSLVYNAEATTLAKGEVVYAFGASGQRVSVKRAVNTSDATSAQTFGVIAESIAAGAEGFCMVHGMVRGIDTSAYTQGDPIYLSASAGQFTKTKPVAPNHLVYLGFVVKINASSGEIFVRCQNGYELAEIHDYLEGSVQNNDVISYETSSGLYKPKSIPTLLGYTPANQATTLTINGTSYDLSANRTWSVGTVTSVAALTLGTTGTDVSSSVANGTTTPVITLNIPTASATNRGALSSTDWTTFNNKLSAAITSLNGLTASTQTFTNDTNVTITSATSTHTLGWSGQLSIARGGTGLSSLGTAGQILRVNSGATALEYFTFTGATASGTTNYVAKFTGASALGNSSITDNGTNVYINAPLTVNSTTSPATGVKLRIDGAWRAYITSDSLNYSDRCIITDSDGTGQLDFVSYVSGSDAYSNSIGIFKPNNASGKDLLLMSGDANIRFVTGLYTEAMRVTNSQEILMGYTTDQGSYKLQVSGNIFSSGSINSGQGRFKDWYNTGTGIACEIGVSGGNGNIISFDRTNTRYTPLILAGGDGAGGTPTEVKIYTNGVGIGVVPSYKLHVVSDGVASYFKSTSTIDTPHYAALQIERETKINNNGVGINFYLRDSGDNLTEYAYIGGLIENNTNGSEYGNFGVWLTRNGTVRKKAWVIKSGNLEELYDTNGNDTSHARRYYDEPTNEHRFYAISSTGATIGVKLMEYSGSTYYRVLTTNTGLQLTGGTLSGALTVNSTFTTNGFGRFYSAVGGSDNVRDGLAHYDTTSQTSGVGGQLVLGYKYTNAGDYTEGAIIKMYKANGTDGDYSSGLKFQVRNTGDGLSTKMTLTPSGRLLVNFNSGSEDVGKVLKMNGAFQSYVTSGGSNSSDRCTITDTNGGDLDIVSYVAGSEAYSGAMGMFVRNGKDALIMANNADIRFVTAGYTERVRIKNGGNVGINTTSPSAKLVVEDGVANQTGAPTYRGSMIISNGGGSTSTSGGLEFHAASSGSGYGWRVSTPDLGSGNIPMLFQSRTNNASWTERIRVTKDGLIGLGDNFTSDDPPCRLSVNGAGSDVEAMRIGNSTGGSGSNTGKTYLGLHHWSTNGSNRTYAPILLGAEEKDLDCYDSHFVIKTRDSVSSPTYPNGRDIAPVERFRIAIGGFIGINQTSPTNQLHLTDSSYDRFALRIQADTGNTANRWSGISFSGETSNNKAALLFVSDGTSYSRGSLMIAINDEANQNNVTPTNSRLKVKSSGQLQLNNYTTTTSFTGTAVGYLAYDSSGNILTKSGITTSIGETTFTQNIGGNTVNENSTFGGYTLQQVVKALIDLGILS